MILCVGVFAPAKAQRSYFLEAEDFRIRGGWIVEKPPGAGASNHHVLRVISGQVKAADALTVVKIAEAGSYTVWARTIDYPHDRPGTRLFQVMLNDAPLENECGRHGKEGYHWEKAGTIQLEAGENVVQLRDSRGNFARVDAVFLTSENIRPEGATASRYKTPHETITPTPAAQPELPAVQVPDNAPVAVALENEFLKLEWRKGEHYAARTAVKRNGSWEYLPGSHEEHRVMLLSADNPQITFGGFFPGWNGSRGYSTFACKGKTYRIMEPANLMNPFLSGTLTAFHATSVTPKGKGKLQVRYQSADGQVITGEWTLLPGHRHIRLDLQFTATKRAYYSLVVTAFQGAGQGQVSNILLPPMFQYQRIPEQPLMLPSAMMPQPVAITERKDNHVALFISGTPDGFPLDWAQAGTSVMGFGMQNEKNDLQPVVFSPVPGLKNAQLNEDGVLRRSFSIGAAPEGWNKALEYVSDSIYGVRDYRHQSLSLTETMFNIIDLMKNDAAAGWAPQLKGFYDIEGDPKAAPTVVQSAPLAVIAAAVLGHDEELFISRALPAIEYTLSRSGFRWAQRGMSKKAGTLSPFGSQFTTAYFEGLHRLLGNTNPWLRKVALPDNQLRDANGYSVIVPKFSQALAAYRMTGQRSWLDSAVKHADAFLREEVYGTKRTPLTKQPFYNTSFYANWWDLSDLYDVTGDTTYLDAAEAAAFHTIAGVRSYPAVKDTLQTIHPGNTYEGNTTMWWKGGEKYRLGFPRKPEDVTEKQVPRALVSPVGLGFEQPYTFFDPGKLVRHVYMSNWAPHLLRLYQQRPRKIYETYARNAVIGRFTNYPGYYATGFQDITLQPDFPYKGPDVSSIYYHHIPPHLAFTTDYLVTEMQQRSGGKVEFPYVKQDGFVWFNNRVYGAGKGKVMGDDGVRLWMKRGLVTIDHPEVNYVTAISDKRFWILLNSESDTPVTCQIVLGAEAPVAADARGVMHADKEENLGLEGRTVTVTIAPKHFAALGFPVAGKKALRPKVSPLKAGMQSTDFGPGIGKCYGFRIRTPFGWDAIYGYLESTLPEGARVVVSMNHREATLTAYPFEWSFHPVDAGEEAVLKVTVTTREGRVFEKNMRL
ncbi:hypothetical protein WJU16_04895 [Chitinophaga pollutisoli]|uniref:Uncharacterized protein n=1 Tax=Chitinophaga pollutisoli TaxID=3133966 RepID=A0ABZ2YSD9_9BACT